MAHWALGREVLVGEGRGEAESSPRPGRSRGLAVVPSPRERGPQGGSLQQETLEKARELFLLCDKEEKGFITKRDMQRLQSELPLSPEQLESVFDSLDRDRNGYLTPLEFSMGLGQFLGVEVWAEGESSCQEEPPLSGWGAHQGDPPEPADLQLSQALEELGAAHIFVDQEELRTLWAGLREERPELLLALQELLLRVSAHIQDTLRERDNLEQTLRRRECDHEQVVRSLYEEMETQMKEVKEKQLMQDSVRKSDRTQQLQRELETREQELHSIVGKQRELEQELRALGAEQQDTRSQNQQLRRVNTQLAEQLEASRQELHRVHSLLQHTQQSTLREQREKERDILKVSKNMQKEKESLMKQLDLLREMNKKLRDEKDARHAQKMAPPARNPLLKKGSVIGKYLLEDKPIKRQLNPTDTTNQVSEEVTSEPDRKKYASHQRGEKADGQLEEAELGQEGDGCPQEGKEDVKETPSDRPLGTDRPPQRVFKLVFIGNSGVGKTSFIQRYCRRSFLPNINATVGMDFQVRTVTVDSTPIALQLWDTAGQERFRSITQQYFRKADGMLAMYDVTSSASFIAVRNWLDSVQERVSEGAVLFLLGNKMDAVEHTEREVLTRDGRRLAQRCVSVLQEYQAVFYECSVKAGLNIDEPMAHLARLLADQQDQEVGSALCLSVESDSPKGCCS
ncbi:EF-hand calcium-binding domain-containing protein 4A [Lepisosteus oculatus]|uniref:EF-hand calcium-binding domain-containing protein 4A n=1 Tax=Lepisosteus oculatus TaxID=7918 RepID=UPI0035F50F98